MYICVKLPSVTAWLRRLEIETRAPLKVARSVAVVSRIPKVYPPAFRAADFFRVFSFFPARPRPSENNKNSRSGSARAAASEVSAVTFLHSDDTFYIRGSLYHRVNVDAAVKGGLLSTLRDEKSALRGPFFFFKDYACRSHETASHPIVLSRVPGFMS